MDASNQMKSKTQSVVSVIVPCYNYAHFLPDCLNSILGQTFKDFEVIIVDDGSTDNTKEIAKRFLSDPRFRYIYQVNQGLSAARNTGIRNAKGEFIGIVDPDDMWFPTKLEEQINFMKEHPSYGLVYSDAELYIDGKPSRRTIRNGKLFHDGWCFEEMLWNNGVVCPSVLIRRECFDHIGLFLEDLRVNEDWEMWLRISRKFKIGSIQKTLLHYRIHERNASAHRLSEHYLTMRKIMSLYTPYLSSRAESRRYLEHHLSKYTRRAFHEGDKPLLIRILPRLFILSPMKTSRWLVSKTLKCLRPHGKAS